MSRLRFHAGRVLGVAVALSGLWAGGCDDCQDVDARDVRPGKDVYVGDAVLDADVADTTDGLDADDTADDVAARDWTLFGAVRLDEALGAVGPGELYVALLTECGTWSSAVDLQDLGEVDLAVEPAQYGFEVASGTWHLAAFLDLDGDADPQAPRPGSGDVALRNATDGTSCVHYELGSGRGIVENALVLDAIVP